MYDLNNDTAGLERHKQLLNEAAEDRRTRKVGASRNLFTQMRTIILRTLSVIVR